MNKYIYLPINTAFMVKQHREDLGLSQEKFAKIYGLKRQTLSAIETGARNMVTKPTLKRVNKIIDDFVAVEEQRISSIPVPPEDTPVRPKSFWVKLKEWVKEFWYGFQN